MESWPSLRCRMRAGTGMPGTIQAMVSRSPEVRTTLVASRAVPPMVICSLPATL